MVKRSRVFLLVKSKAAVKTNYRVMIKDIADVTSDDSSLKEKIETTNIYKTGDNEEWLSISSIFIIEKLLDKYEDLDIEIIGGDEVLIEVKTKVRPNPVLRFVKVASISLLLFFGAGITIMNFHTDVDMDKSMEVLYFALTGKEDPNPLALTVSYSIGIGLGVLVFFNRIISKNPRRKMEPGPMELELYSYDREMEEYILNDINKSDKE